MTSFAADIAAWALKVEGAVETIFKESAQDVVAEMQTPVSQGGNMPIDTGFLRASLMASTAEMPSLSRSNPGVPVSSDFGQVELVIAGADVGQTLFFGYTANYAGHVEYGANGRAPRRFVALAAQNWREIVNRNTVKVRTALGL